MIGQTISHYKITEKLGEGGMGIVYKAEDTKLKRSVALKFLRSDVLEDEEHKERFLREAQAAAALDHSNICTVYEIDEADGQTFLSMAYLGGETVKEKIKARPLKLEDALDIAIQTADGLQAAHEKGIVHRDIKSANLMVTPRRQVKIMDFGLAQLAERSQLTKTAMILGTPAYMSPEQARREPTDRRTDVWSLGVVIYEMVTGRVPFEGERQEAILYAIANEEPEPLTAQRVDVPVELDRIVGKAMAKSPDERYQHIDEMIVDLRALEKQRESEPARVAGAPPVPVPAGHKRTTLAAAAVLAAALIIAAALSFRPVAEESPPSLQPVALTTYPGLETEPAFSPDGDQVVFSWTGENDDNADIYVQLIGTTNPLRLTTDPAEDIVPAWSPDGLAIAFVRGSVDNLQIVLIPALGGPERKLAEVARFNFPRLDWSPDGNWLVTQDRDSPSEPLHLVLISARSGEKRRLMDPKPQSYGDYDAAFSPDGRQLAFTRAEAFIVGYIHVIELAENLSPRGEPAPLTKEPYGLPHPVWTPDGREIVFQHRSSRDKGLWRVLTSSPGEPERLPFGGASSGAAVSRQGNRLVYASRIEDLNVWRLDLAAQGEEGPSARKLIASTKQDWNASYSPDGSRIVFTSNRVSSGATWVCDADGANPVQLTSLRGGTPRWSPDGKWIAFDARTGGSIDIDGKGDIWLVASAGGEPQLLTEDESGDLVPNWSRDGKWVYFASNRGGDFQVWKQPAAGGEAVQVTRRGGFHGIESPDGQWVYFNERDGEGEVWKIPADGGQETKVLESTRGFAGFAPAQDGIFYLSPPAAGSRPAIRFLNFADGTTETILESETPASTLTLSPDGRYLLYDQNDLSGSDLMLVEGFR